MPDPVAHLASEIGVLALKRGYSQWLQADHDTQGALAPYTAAASETYGQPVRRSAKQSPPPSTGAGVPAGPTSTSS